MSRARPARRREDECRWSRGSDPPYEGTRLAAAIQAYWTNSAKTGDPNGPGSAEWPRYEPESRPFPQLTRTGEIRDARDQRGAFCDLVAERLARADSKP